MGASPEVDEAGDLVVEVVVLLLVRAPNTDRRLGLLTILALDFDRM